jgi:hypothetical protein
MTDALIEGLKVCSDTERHLAEWRRRKEALLDFVAEFEDGRQITVGVACSPDKLDPGRGVFFARCAYSMTKRPPKIIRARFEFRGKVLARYEQGELN